MRIENLDQNFEEENRKREEELRRIFKGIDNVDAIFRAFLSGDFELVEDIKEENRKNDIKISFSFRYKGKELLHEDLNRANNIIYSEIENDQSIPIHLRENFGLEWDGDAQVIRPSFLIDKDTYNLEDLKAEAILALRDIKKMLGIRVGK